MLSPRVNRDPVTRPVSLAVSVALLAATIAVAGFTASAQSFSTVSGTVVDQQGALLPGVAVVLTNARSGQKYEVRTTQTGRSQLVGIPSGEFTLSVRQPGFRPVEERMTVSRDVQRDLSLRIGTLQETVTVTATPGDRSAAGQQYNVDAIRERFKETVASCNASATGGNIRPPRKITHVSPLYPEGLRAAAIGGAVKLDATIDGQGRVRDVAPVPNQTIDPGLVSAAIDAVNQWEFTGTLLNCVPVDVVMTVTVNFNPNQ